MPRLSGFELYSRWVPLSIKRRGSVISPGYYEPGPWLLSPENRKKNKTKEIPICFISRLLVVFIDIYLAT